MIPYGEVWRTGANAATQFTTSVPITIAGVHVPAGAYTLWTLPDAAATSLIINKQTGQWGTSYDAAQDLARSPMQTTTANPAVDRFTIAIQSSDDRHGTLTMEWGPFRWTAPIVVDQAGR